MNCVQRFQEFMPKLGRWSNQGFSLSKCEFTVLGNTCLPSEKENCLKNKVSTQEIVFIIYLFCNVICDLTVRADIKITPVCS